MDGWITFSRKQPDSCEGSEALSTTSCKFLMTKRSTLVPILMDNLGVLRHQYGASRLACWFGNAAAEVATCFWGHLALYTYILYHISYNIIYHISYIIYLEKKQSIHDDHTRDQIGKNKLAILHWAPDVCICWQRENAKVQGKYDLAVPGALQSQGTQNRNCWSVSQ